ncbi:MAG: SDR family NAD(P)-dependent oxidoreductase [Chitinophagales bacterium]
MMKPNHYQNKICWITGASSGIGASLAISLSRLGARLILSARTRENLEKVRIQCSDPDKVVILVCDMESLSDLSAVAKESWTIYKRIDYVFLNAGFAVRDMVINTDLEMFQKEMNINYFSSVVISKTLLPFMLERKSGAFVVTSSLSGKYGIPKLAAYSASKHALHGFFESLRAEHEADGIQVTIIIAGLVKTDITLHALKGNGEPYAMMEESITRGISPELCASQIVQAVAKRKNEALVGGIEKYSVLFKRFFPGILTYAIRNHPVRILKKLGLL